MAPLQLPEKFVIKTKYFIIDKHFKLFQGQQRLLGVDVLNNTNFNSKTHEIKYQPIKKRKR